MDLSFAYDNYNNSLMNESTTIKYINNSERSMQEIKDKHFLRQFEHALKKSDE